MSCVLRIAGTNLDIDGLLSDLSMSPVAVFRKGTPRSRAPDANRHLSSGANFLVTDAGFSEFEGQLEAALAFLDSHADDLRKMSACVEVQRMGLDFAVDRRAGTWCSFRFPVALLTAAAAAGIYLELSVYPSGLEPEAMADIDRTL